MSQKSIFTLTPGFIPSDNPTIPPVEDGLTPCADWLFANPLAIFAVEGLLGDVMYTKEEVDARWSCDDDAELNDAVRTVLEGKIRARFGMVAGTDIQLPDSLWDHLRSVGVEIWNSEQEFMSETRGAESTEAMHSLFAARGY